MSAAAVRIVPLADARFAIPVLRQWFIAEWAPWYGPGGKGDAEADLLAWCDANRLPLAMVALGADDQVLGTSALKAEVPGAPPDTGPWLAALLVGTPHRRRGVGAALIAAIEVEARRLGYAAVYAATDSAATLFKRCGWEMTERTLPTLRGSVPVFCCRFGA